MKNLFKTREFWLALLTIVVLVLGVFFQGFTLDVETAVGMAVIVAGYLISFAINPSGAGLGNMLKSRKFWAAVLGFLILFLDAFHVFPNALDNNAVIGVVVLISAYMVMVAKDPGNGWRGLLVSRKFWAAVIGLVINLLVAFNISLPQGLTADSILGITMVFTGAIASFGLQKPPAELPDPEIIEE